MMTTPVTYQPKTLANIDAMYMGDNGENSQAVATWVSPMVPEDAQISFGAWGNEVQIWNDPILLTAKPGDYIYVDEDGLHAVNKGAFELLYEVSSGV